MEPIDVVFKKVDFPLQEETRDDDDKFVEETIINTKQQTEGLERRERKRARVVRVRARVMRFERDFSQQKKSGCVFVKKS